MGVFTRFHALTAEYWEVNDHRKRKELTMNQSKTTLLRSRNPKGLVFSSPEFSAEKGLSTLLSGDLTERSSPKSDEKRSSY